ncbi:E3 ubiquitin-protein ligase DCST1-like [Littorina saxatilis]|uniref:Dendritic cell-specific transmembrane protein-like domain-containing protein n=1 Tax=Littorina saxatilis TaxID=31220 RepID=A0AAN9BQR0_9CAEN
MSEETCSLCEISFSEEESVWSFNNNCSSQASDRSWSMQDRNWSAEDKSTKPLLSKKSKKSKAKKQPDKLSKKQSKSSFKDKKRKKGFIAFMRRLVKSNPSEHRMLKAALCFPLGVVFAGGLFLLVVQPLDLDPDVRNLVGSLAGLVLATGFAFSVQVRCIMLLVIPTFFSRAGRSLIAALAIILLLSGPVDNIVTNCREMARSLSCLAELLANHTLAKWKLRLNPLKETIQSLQEEGFMVQQISQTVKNAFGPITKELEDQSEVSEMEQDLKEVEEILGKSEKKAVQPPVQPALGISVNQVEEKHGAKDKMSQAEVIQEKWEKKMELRCEEVFGKAVIRCREWFGDLWDKCLSALWVLGYVLCLPLKMTFFCQLVKMVPGALGLDCDSMDVVEPGLGDTYQAAKDMINEVASGMKVNLQYRLTGAMEAGPNLMTAEKIRSSTMNEFESKARWANFLILLVKRALAFTFLLVFRTAHVYHSGYLTKFQHDNVYITSYFRRIDARRRAAGKQVLLPLKKSEKQTLVFPNSIKLMPREKTQVSSGAAVIVLRIVMTALVVYVDYLLVWIMDVIYRNSKMEYHQAGEHFVNITVTGAGFMADIVRMFLSSFNSHQKLDSITTNFVCLPEGKGMDTWRTVLVFAVYGGLFLFMLVEAFGLRLRRTICAFFYRKREKKRVLYLYNELLKKRKGYLRHMRHRIRKQIRKRTLKGQTGVLTALTLQFPRLCRCLKWLKSARESCLICEEPEGKTFQRCPTRGCGWGYCKECWKDIKYTCYACTGKQDGESGTDPSDENDDLSSDDSDVDNDNNFLH